MHVRLRTKWSCNDETKSRTGVDLRKLDKWVDTLHCFVRFLATYGKAKCWHTPNKNWQNLICETGKELRRSAKAVFGVIVIVHGCKKGVIGWLSECPTKLLKQRQKLDNGSDKKTHFNWIDANKWRNWANCCLWTENCTLYIFAESWLDQRNAFDLNFSLLIVWEAGP